MNRRKVLSALQAFFRMDRRAFWVLFVVYLALTGMGVAYFLPQHLKLAVVLTCVPVDIMMVAIFVRDYRVIRRMPKASGDQAKIRRTIAEDAFFGVCVAIHNIYLIMCAFS